MKRFRRILAILTDSPADRSALRWARQVADRAHTERIDILILDAEPADWVPEFPPSGDEEPWKDRVHEVSGLIDDELAGLDGPEVRTKTSIGATLPSILNELIDSNSDLAVLGVADEEGRRLAEKLARKSPASVLTVPADCAVDGGPILTAVDFSEPCALALEVANAFASSFETEIRALHSFRIPERAKRAAVSEESLRDSHREAALHHLSGFLTQQLPPDAALDPVVRESGLPSSAVLDELAEHPCSLVVAATRGRSSLARALLGSNTAELIRRSPRPVLAVKAKGEGLPLLRALLGAGADAPAELASAR